MELRSWVGNRKLSFPGERLGPAGRTDDEGSVAKPRDLLNSATASGSHGMSRSRFRRTTPLRVPRRPVRILAAAAATALLVGGCGSADDWSGPRPDAASVGSLGSGYTDPATPPPPESTITPAPGSWDDIHPAKGYRVVLLTAGEDRATRTLVAAVDDWAEAEDVSLKTITADDPHRYLDRIEDAMALSPHLIISAGKDLVDPLTPVTANHLDQQFLVVGAELPEPTHNVTAANWTGASFRGEGNNTSSGHDPATFTPERSARAVRAGVAAVLNDLTGIVIWLP